MIKDDCIKPDYLASNLNGVNETGIYMLDSAINSDDGKKIDDCTRRILRSMGCPPAGRGKIFHPGNLENPLYHFCRLVKNPFDCLKLVFLYPLERVFSQTVGRYSRQWG
jgi:hypothetical protein